MNPTNATRKNMGDGYGTSTFSIDPPALGISEGHCFKTWGVWLAWSVGIYFVLYLPLSKIIGAIMGAAGASMLAIQITSTICCWPIAYLVFRRVVKRLIAPLDKRWQQDNPMAAPLMVPSRACVLVWVVYTALNYMISFILGALTSLVIGFASGTINPAAATAGASVARLASLYLTFRYLAVKMLLASVRGQMKISSTNGMPLTTASHQSPQATPQSNEQACGIATEIREPERMESTVASSVSENIRRTGGDVFLRKVRLGNALEKAGKEQLTASEKVELARIREEYVAGEEAFRAGEKSAAEELFSQAEVELAGWLSKIATRRAKEEKSKRDCKEARAKACKKAAIAAGLLLAIGLLAWGCHAAYHACQEAQRQKQLAAEETERQWQLAEEEAKRQRQLIATRAQVKKLGKGTRAGEMTTILLPDNVPMEMVWCPPGEFMMGNANGNDSEKPVHHVTLSKGFWMAKREVTQKQWKSVMGTTVRQQQEKDEENVLPLADEKDDSPMNYVNWNEAQEFCQKTGLQLPTESQWEYACQAGRTTEYFKRVGYGEWCADWYGDYPNHTVTDPMGPDWGWARVCRYMNNDNKLNSPVPKNAPFTFTFPNRIGRSPHERAHDKGFRPVRVQP